MYNNIVPKTIGVIDLLMVLNRLRWK